MKIVKENNKNIIIYLYLIYYIPKTPVSTLMYFRINKTRYISLENYMHKWYNIRNPLQSHSLKKLSNLILSGFALFFFNIEEKYW